MQIKHIVLTSHTEKVQMADLAPVAAALQKQATLDFGPVWQVGATVDIAGPDDIPGDALVITIDDLIDRPGSEGYHQIFQSGTPYAVVKYGPTWSLTASHECLEMLADGSGQLKQSGPSLRQDQGIVDYLIEVCDPCQDIQFAYQIDGIVVSDFYTPAFFSAGAASGARYDQRCQITAPRQVLPGGYLSWFTADGMTWQAKCDRNGQRQIVSGGNADGRANMSLREFVDSLTPGRQDDLSDAILPEALQLERRAAQAARRANGARLRGDIARRFPRPAAPGSEGASK